jgi:hypothetical protein
MYIATARGVATDLWRRSDLMPDRDRVGSELGFELLAGLAEVGVVAGDRHALRARRDLDPKHSKATARSRPLCANVT